ncbi:PAS domain S-box [Rivularia sp. PCC 7116]|uniref:ATP-binding protein n=1 Tax=Rivularia sp. PCC 7116 TaxID=373994 RepID=UPI00029F0295|nr:ATP-binding protein [Rivularia sp. PCC 7116]AFY53656.1 PAS domain S-box [Rivularia sp. PCC 7116]
MKNSKSLDLKATDIKQEEKPLQQFLQLISDLWCMVTEDGCYQQLNGDRWKSLLGWNESELISKPMLTIVHPEDREAISQALSELIKNQVIELKARYLHHDGSFRWISWRINKNEDEIICGIGKEITLDELQSLVNHQDTGEIIKCNGEKIDFIKEKIQNIQQELQLLQGEYQQKSISCLGSNSNNNLVYYTFNKQPNDSFNCEKFYKSLLKKDYEPKTLEKIISNINQGILLLDSKYHIILANHNAKNYLKIIAQVGSNNRLNEIAGNSIEDLIHSTEENKIHKLILQYCPDSILEIVVQLIEPKQEHNQWLVTIHNISVVGQLDLDVRKALEKEKEINLLKSNVVNTVSHEYRTPLTNIILGVQLLKKYHGNLDSKRQMRCLQHIETSGKYMMHLVDNMLLVNKAKSGKLEVHRSSLDLISFIEQLVEEYKLVLDTDCTINFIHECSCLEANLDSNILRQILTNLLSNAIKYSPNGGEVNLNLAYSDGVVLFQVSDKGIGIHKQDNQKLFESFQRGSNAGTIRGTGLGLAIVKKCVELHGGEIWFDSVVGKGTNFYVKLPC